MLLKCLALTLQTWEHLKICQGDCNLLTPNLFLQQPGLKWVCHRLIRFLHTLIILYIATKTFSAFQPFRFKTQFGWYSEVESSNYKRSVTLIMVHIHP